MFNDHKFKAPFPWDEGEVGESVHIPKGTVHEKQFTRDTDFLKEKYTAVTKLYEVAYNRWHRSGTNSTECYCLCGTAGFYSSSGFKRSQPGNADAHEGNRPWHAIADKVVYVYYLAGKNVPEFTLKATSVMPEGVRSTGKLKGMSHATNISQGVSVRSDCSDV